MVDEKLTTNDKYEKAIKAAMDAVFKINESYIKHLISLRATDLVAYNTARSLLTPDLLNSPDEKLAD